MRIIPPAGFITMPWKNGGGLTHEILKEERDGRLLWRLSIAEVGSDGPFSAFPGLSRILTVINGHGLLLTTPDYSLRAAPLEPLHFSGDLAVNCRRVNGNVQDFNVIYDGAAIAANVLVHGRDQSLQFHAGESSRKALLCLAGARTAAREVAKGALAVADDQPAEITCLAPFLEVTLIPRPIQVRAAT